MDEQHPADKVPFPKQDDDRLGIPERSAAIVFSAAGEGQMDIKLIFPLGVNPSEAADQPSLASMRALDLLMEDAKDKPNG